MPEILMPRLSDTMEEGTLSRWLKHEGDQIRRGDVIAEIETDKAVMDLEAYDEGQLTRTLVPEGATVPIGTPVAVVGEQPTTATTAPPAAPPGAPAVEPEPPAPLAAPAEPAAPPAPIPAAETTTAPQQVPASPLARRITREHGIDITSIHGSGPGGRVVRADVEKAAARRGAEAAPMPGAPPAPAPPHERPPAQPAAGETEEVPLSTVRRLTAQRLVQSAQQAPHFYLTRIVDAEPLLTFRSETNARLGEQGPRISVNDLIVKACATALRSHPELNVSWAETRILRHRRIHIGIAVALDDGLTEDMVCSLEKPMEAPNLTDGDRAALEYADLFATNHFAIGDAMYDKLGKYFSPQEIVELGLFSAYFLGYGRFLRTINVVEELDSNTQQAKMIGPWQVGKTVIVDDTDPRRM